MSADTEGERWICAACGTRHDNNEQPCRNCASEQFAKLEEPDTHRIQEPASITWVCQDCGTTAPRNDGPCRTCGGFNYDQKNNSSSSSRQATQSSQTTLPTTLSVRTLIAGLAGVFALLQSLGALIQSHASVILYLGALAVALPTIRRRFEQWTEIEITTPAAVVLYILFNAVGNLWIYGNL